MQDATQPTGPTLAALVDDLERLNLDKAPTAHTLAAAAMALARALDEEPNAAAARELRHLLANLAAIASPNEGDDLERFLAELSPFAKREEGDGPMVY